MTLRTVTIDHEPWTEHPALVYCRTCDTWTHPAAEDIPEDGLASARCWTCGDDYQCDTCGATVLLDTGGRPECEHDPAH